MDAHLVNILLLGLAFMILFTAFQATSMVEQSVLEGVKNDTINGTDFQGSGYLSLAIVYIFFSVTNVFAPAVVSTLGPTVSMFVGASTYFWYILSFIAPMVWSFYLAAILLGIGGAILWTAEGAYLAIYSNQHTASRNIGVFWALFQISLLPGNLYLYLSLKTGIITRSTRYPLFAVFSIVSVVSLALFAVIIWCTYRERRRSNTPPPSTEGKVKLADLVQTLKVAFRLIKTRHMLLLLFPFAYTGFSQTFFQTVYPTCIGHTIKYGDARKSLIGLHGILVGVGEILGGGLFGFISKPKTSSQRALVILIGFVLQIVFYYSVFVNFPFDAPATETDAKSYFEFNSLTSQIIAFIGSVLVGLGDGALNTQLFSVLATHYKDTSASAFAIFQLFQGVASAIAYLYASTFGLHYQLLIVVISLLLSTLSLFLIFFDDSSIDETTSAQSVNVLTN